MLTITVQGDELWDEKAEVFTYTESTVLQFEHSLVSLSKWESFFEKPFLDSNEKTFEETMWYIEAMSVTPDVPPEVFLRFTQENLDAIKNYIDAKMTATWFKAEPTRRQTEIITAEIIYYWMISLNIPFECQHWHLNRLMTLVQVINQKNAPQKKMSPRDVAARNRQLNKERQAKLNTTG